MIVFCRVVLWLFDLLFAWLVGFMFIIIFVSLFSLFVIVIIRVDEIDFEVGLECFDVFI